MNRLDGLLTRVTFIGGFFVGVGHFGQMDGMDGMGLGLVLKFFDDFGCGLIEEEIDCMYVRRLKQR